MVERCDTQLLGYHADLSQLSRAPESQATELVKEAFCSAVRRLILRW
jgi:hypothetical protein